VSAPEGSVAALPEDSQIRELVARAMAAAERREAESPTVAAGPVTAPASDRARGGKRPTRLLSDRACVETNLARKGLWRAGGVGTGEQVDALGAVRRIDSGPTLGALAFDVMVWICSRWRELDVPDERAVPFTLAGLTDDLAWKRGGGATHDLAATVDALTQATFRARVFNATTREMRVDTFGLVDRWERGERDRPGRTAESGFLVLGDWLHEQLGRGNLTYLSWSELRALRGHASRRLFAYLEAERFESRFRREVDAGLYATLGIEAAEPWHRLATLRRGAAEVSRRSNRYRCVAVEASEHRGDWRLVAHRDALSERPQTRAVRAMQTRAVGAMNQGSPCDEPGQSVR
jgi:hypothetical protein